MLRRSLIQAAPALALGVAWHAQAASDAAGSHRYVAVSLVSDRLVDIGSPSRETGTSIHRGVETVVPLPGAPFDRTVLEVLAGEVPRIDPDARLSFLAASTPESYDGQLEWFHDGKVDLPGPLRAAVAGEGASRLLLVTKTRGDAHVTDGRRSNGIGKLSGLGFYRNSWREVQDAATGQVGRGYVAPYVYVTMSLVDLQTFSVVRQAATEMATPYSDMSRQDEYDRLQQVLVEGIRHATQAVLKPD